MRSSIATLLIAVATGVVLSGPLQASLLTVTTTSDVIDGDVSSVAALLAAPGADGVSLREAVAAVNATPGAHTITFSSALTGVSIALGRPVLEVTRADVTIAGLVGNDGLPLVTLVPPSFGSEPALFVYGSGFTMTDLRFTGVEYGVVAVVARTRQYVSRIRIERNVFDNSGLTITEPRPPPVIIGPEKGSTDASVTGVRVANNRFNHFPDVMLGIGSDGCFRSVVSDIVVEENEFTDAIFGFECGASGVGNQTSNIRVERNTFTRLFGAIALLNGNGSDNLVQDVLVSHNVFKDNEGKDVGMSGGLHCDLCTVRNVRIFGNQMQTHFVNAGAVELRGGTASKGSIVEDVRIEGNRIISPFNPIALAGALEAGTDNVVRNTIIRKNTVIVDPSLASLAKPNARTIPFGYYAPGPVAVYLVGGIEQSTGSMVNGVSILNNTLVLRGGYGVWAEPNGAATEGNTVASITVRNTIFDAGGDDIRGQVDGDQVSYCLLSGAQVPGGRNNIVGDPQFVDPGRNDFHLRPASPAIDHGASDGVPATDIDCRPRLGTPDIGAYEFAAPGVARLSLAVTEGNGAVGVSPAGLECGAATSYLVGTVVELRANPAPGWRISAWSGDPDCVDGVVTMSSDRRCSATFSLVRRRAVRR